MIYIHLRLTSELLRIILFYMDVNNVYLHILLVGPYIN